MEVKGDDLKEGMYLEAQLDACEQENAIKISRKLLMDESKIFIVKDSILDVIDVEPVYFSPNDVVVQGVPGGTLILSKSISRAYAGMLVKVNQNNTSTNNEIETVE